MKFFYYLIFILLTINVKSQSVTNTIPDSLLSAIDSNKLSKFCDDSVYVVLFDNQKGTEKYVLKKNIDDFFFKKFYNPKLKYKFLNMTSDGKVVAFGQYDSKNRPVRFFYLYFNYENDKLVVLEIFKTL